MSFFWYSGFSRDRIYSYENPYAPLYFTILGNATFYYFISLHSTLFSYFTVTGFILVLFCEKKEVYIDSQLRLSASVISKFFITCRKI